MLRFQVFLCWGAVWTAIWYQATKSQNEILNYSPLPEKYTIILINFFPLLILSTLAIYGLSIILYGVLTLSDFPQAASELEKEILEAKLDMNKRGVPVVLSEVPK
mmetsp:Transcript_18165/g.27479  ORF Transcript_18165/g.27479 Transcript_18165/m.27479 type:complete len:105 (+) Transcript_18165:182-496(+)